MDLIVLADIIDRHAVAKTMRVGDMMLVIAMSLQQTLDDEEAAGMYWLIWWQRQQYSGA